MTTNDNRERPRRTLSHRVLRDRRKFLCFGRQHKQLSIVGEDQEYFSPHVYYRCVFSHSTGTLPQGLAGISINRETLSLVADRQRPQMIPPQPGRVEITFDVRS